MYKNQCIKHTTQIIIFLHLNLIMGQLILMTNKQATQSDNT